MPLPVTLITRDWDYLTPILLGEVSDPRIDLNLKPVAKLIGPPSMNEGVDAAEMSLSRFVIRAVEGTLQDEVIASFPMRGFRHRCIITRKSHPAETLEALRGGRIGIAGWQDTGNTWTRHAMLSAGVGLDEIHWFIGRMSSDSPALNEVSPYVDPGRIDQVADNTPLLDLLERGELDAVFTPFMPDGFFGPDPVFRPVLPDLVSAELAYYRKHGFIPGIHSLSLNRDVARANPWLGQALSDLLDRAQAVWTRKRWKYSDTSPWLFDEQLRAGRYLPEDWNPSGLAANREMIAAFIETAFEQNLIPRTISPEEVFAATP